MQLLPITFNILTICGFWRPSNFESPFLKYSYDFYSCIMSFLIYTFTMSHLIEIFRSANNFEDLTGSCFMLLSMLNVCCKMTNILYFRKPISELLNILETEPCQPNDNSELQIMNKFNTRARFVAICYATLTESTCMLITARTFFGTPDRLLPFTAWVPYSLKTSLRYWLTFFHQTVAHVTAANLQIANEVLICGLMIQVCAQLELLKHRIQRVPSLKSDVDRDFNSSQISARNRLIKCVDHHRQITRFCGKLTDTFYIIIFFQFAISLLVLCSSVYLLSKMQLGSVQFMSLSLYLSCMLFQIFLFCWYGNEVILQSISINNSMYCMDWTSLSQDVRKDFFTAMLLMRKPIKFTSSFLITLSIDSYCKILKTSYSVFNLLQRTPA